MAKQPPEQLINWETDDDLVVHKQMPIRAYFNKYQNVVLCQESEDPHEEDPFIVIRTENVPAVIAALTRLIAGRPEPVE